MDCAFKTETIPDMPVYLLSSISPLVPIDCGQGGISLRKHLPIFYSALLLTGVNLLLRLAGTSFQVYLSSRIGAAGIGLLQLTLSVGNMAMVAGMAGIRTASMYLTAEELGKKRPRNVTWVLSGCILYSILFSGAVALLLYLLAPVIAANWIGDIRVLGALRLLAAFLPVSCLCGVMTGYFTAAQRIGTLAAVEVAEQLCAMGATLTLLHFRAGSDPGKACLCVVLGSALGACLTLLCLTVLRLLERAPTGERIPVSRRLRDTALPLALADNLRTGISTVENLMVPKRLALNALVQDPLAAFGTVSGMVFPILMFPACILYGLAELLIPELARCAAAGSKNRISYLVRRSLRVSMLYGVLFAGLLFLLSAPLCTRLYGSEEAGRYLRLYSLLAPVLYCDAITDAMTKGLGQQKACVRYNILTNCLDVLFLFFLLPEYGMAGYFLSFLLTHLLNFILSLRRLLKITGERLAFHIPALTIFAALCSIWAVSHLSEPGLQAAVYPIVLGCGLYLLRIIGREDIAWFRGLVKNEK